jgi:hypothetical protein
MGKRNFLGRPPYSWCLNRHRESQLKSSLWPADLDKGMPVGSGAFLENNMNAKLSIVLVAAVALFVSGCGSSPQSLIVGKWEVAGAKVGGAEAVRATEIGKAIKMTAEFNGDGTARMTMMGQTMQAMYKLDGNQMEWTVNGITMKSKVKVTQTELELTDDANRTITYKRK